MNNLDFITVYMGCPRTWQLSRDVLTDAGFLCNRPAFLRDMCIYHKTGKTASTKIGYLPIYTLASVMELSSLHSCTWLNVVRSIRETENVLHNITTGVL